MVLQQLSRIAIRFSPWAAKDSCSAREIVQRLSGPQAKASNPDCKIEVLVRVKGEPMVAVQYKNGVIDRFPSAALSAQQILARLRDRSAELEAAEFLAKSGAAGNKLDSPWGRGDEAFQSGTAVKVPN